MNVIRYYLSFCVVIAHTASLCGIGLWWFQSSYMAVGCFFTISGFLMFPSFEKRPTWSHYVSRRARRILPPYFMIVLLCGILLVGVSGLTAAAYYSDWGFWKYMGANLSFMNFLHPDLPGVFSDGRFVSHAVNGSLWTMKGEWACYLTVPLVYGVIRRFPRQSGIILGGIVLASVCLNVCFSRLEAVTDQRIYGIIAKQFGGLVVFFYIGALINRYLPAFMRYKWWILVIDILLLLVGDCLPFYDVVLRPLAGSTLVVWVSLVGNWGARLSRHDNVSYDIYLFHFPIIQLAVYFNLPQHLSPIMVLITVTAASSLLAVLSWNLIGRRFMVRKCG